MRIFYDVDTQNDFMNADGELYVREAESLKPNLAKLTNYACTNRIQIVGSVDKHFGTKEYKDKEGELQRNGGPFPDHCMVGTYGQLKISVTNVPAPVFLPNMNTVPFIASTNPTFIEKQTFDVFSNPVTKKVLKELFVTEAIVYGVATDYCVKDAVLGMQQLGIQTYVVEDAIKGITPEGTAQAIDEMKTAGAVFVTTAQVLEDRL